MSGWAHRLRGLHDLKVIRAPMGCPSFAALVRMGCAERAFIMGRQGAHKCDYRLTAAGSAMARTMFNKGG